MYTANTPLKRAMNRAMEIVRDKGVMLFKSKNSFC